MISDTLIKPEVIVFVNFFLFYFNDYLTDDDFLPRFSTSTES